MKKSDKPNYEEYVFNQIEIFMLINKCRQNPKLLITLLQNIIPRFDGKIYQPKNNTQNYITNEGVDVVYEAIKFLENQDPLPPLIFSKGLFFSAKMHCHDIGENGIASHQSSDGLTLSQRVDTFGKWKDLIAENIAFNDYYAEDIIINFVLDDGNPQRGHRKNMFNPDLNYIGVACGYHCIHENCCVINFSSKLFEYQDLDIESEEFEFFI